MEESGDIQYMAFALIGVSIPNFVMAYLLCFCFPFPFAGFQWLGLAPKVSSTLAELPNTEVKCTRENISR